MIAGAAVLVLVVAWYLLLWAPQSKSLRVAQKAYAAAQQKVADDKAQVTQLQAIKKQIPQDNAKFAQLQAALPDNPHLDQALQLLHDAANQTGILLTTLSPSAPAGGTSSSGQSGASMPGGPSIALNMTFQGSFNQVKSFLQALSNLQRTLVVDKVAISGDKDPVAGTMSARVFYEGQSTP